MAPLEQHVKDCVRFLGDGHAEVHRWLDQYMATKGGTHRQELHHVEGIEAAARLYGEEGRKAAIVHILRDCRNIPRREDYANGFADALGGRKDWPVAAYARYTEDAFGALVNYHLNGPEGSLLWGFIGDGLEQFWTSVIKPSTEKPGPDIEAWEKAKDARGKLPQLAPLRQDELQPFSDADNAIVAGLFDEQPGLKEMIMAMVREGVNAGFAWVPARALISPIAVIDYQHIEELRAELQGDDKRALIRFAFHGGPEVRFSASVHGHTMVVNSRNHGATVSVPRLEMDPDGTPFVRFDLGATAEFINVNASADRLYLTNGIHRSYLLASMGFESVPALLVPVPTLSTLASFYPQFTPSVLRLARPPTVRDFFDETLTTRVRMINKQKAIVLAASELPVPIL